MDRQSREYALESASAREIVGGIPRVRGEQAATARFRSPWEGSSPRARGAALTAIAV